MLELKNIRFDVQEGTNEIEIIRDVSFTIPDNKFVVITGPNGGGKSTLARLIAGIEKPSGGTILLDGEDITEKSITDRARMGISYAMQQPVRFKGIQVLDLLRLAVGKRVSVADACQYLSKVGRAPRTTSSAKSTPASPAASSRGSRSLLSWPAEPSSLFLTSPRQASTSGASRT